MPGAAHEGALIDDALMDEIHSVLDRPETVRYVGEVVAEQLLVVTERTMISLSQNGQ